VIGLMRGYAKLLGRHSIRVNSVHPMGVATPMVMNEQFAQLYANPESAKILDVAPRLLPINILEAADVSNAIVWLVSDDARAITGITLPVDAGVTSP
jgi:NAD(P)-dependent dehydrogenase (short-subunit alcohol dehydrogenase family)